MKKRRKNSPERETHGTVGSTLTVPEHEAKIIDILKYQREWIRFCEDNEIIFVDDDEISDNLIENILETGQILPFPGGSENVPGDARPLAWENMKKHWQSVS
uniref:Uncharacterized protein n=1 Tax=Lotharella oceanica TaxID=641309 RepID=A0A7S2TEB6_9EUKA|mmetsp:Transcript_10001/g.19193  ORF Transcript_10001/g.19193 Transcript_10001/m.19193 type:complete len:102 (+) Transcript_10001:381-686(+)